MHHSFCFKLISMHTNLKQQVVPEKNQKVINKILKYIIIAKENIKIKRIINNLVPEDLNETKRNKTKQNETRKLSSIGAGHVDIGAIGSATHLSPAPIATCPAPPRQSFRPRRWPPSMRSCPRWPRPTLRAADRSTSRWHFCSSSCGSCR